jgi:hypothetical protein
MTLYNLKSTPSGDYRITKFTTDLEVESSYTLTRTECTCPAGALPTCRHRKMLPAMLAEGICDSGEFMDYDTGHIYHIEHDMDSMR